MLFIRDENNFTRKNKMDLHYFELYANMQTSIFALTNIIKLTYIKTKQKAEGGFFNQANLKIRRTFK